MARIKTSSIISDIRGSVGGTTFQLSRGGLVMKNKITRRSRNSLNQINNNYLLHRVQQSWRNLTDNQRSTWSAFSNFQRINQKNNKKHILSGYELFIKNNYYRVLYDFEIKTAPEFSKYYSSAFTGSLSLDAGALIFNSDRMMSTALDFIILSITGKLPVSVNNPSSRYRIIKFVTTDSDEWKITVPYSSIFGVPLVPGDTVFFKYTNASLLSTSLNPFKSSRITF